MNYSWVMLVVLLRRYSVFTSSIMDNFGCMIKEWLKPTGLQPSVGEKLGREKGCNNKKDLEMFSFIFNETRSKLFLHFLGKKTSAYSKGTY